MHKSALYVQKTMKHCKQKWGNYYILKMDIAKYFDNINKNILLKILEEKIKDKDLMWLLKQILFAQPKGKINSKTEIIIKNIKHLPIYLLF